MKHLKKFESTSKTIRHREYRQLYKEYFHDMLIGFNDNSIVNLSEILGFENFLARNTGRFFHHGRVEELTSWPVKNDNDLEPPADEKYRNRSMIRLTELKKEYNNIKEC